MNRVQVVRSGMLVYTSVSVRHVVKVYHGFTESGPVSSADSDALR
jgi:hypothetical protein